ncbi:MAG: hypothetical protein AB4372_31285 [Xenococcus sp. (in: cyanobacteria)]
MSYKPGDFYLGIIDFFAGLLPGLMLLTLQGGFLLSGINHICKSPGNQEVHSICVPQSFPSWIIFIVFAYIVGQLIKGLGYSIQQWVPRHDLEPGRKKAKKYYDFVSSFIENEENHPKRKINSKEEKYVDFLTEKPRRNFCSSASAYKDPYKEMIILDYAFSRLRLGSQAVISEIEQQAANYKLFRGLVILFGIDLIIMFLRSQQSDVTSDNGVFILISILLGVSAFRYLQLRNWVEARIYEFYLIQFFRSPENEF